MGSEKWSARFENTDQIDQAEFEQYVFDRIKELIAELPPGQLVTPLMVGSMIGLYGEYETLDVLRDRLTKAPDLNGTIFDQDENPTVF